MTRGRKPNATPSVAWNIALPVDLAAKVELRLFDPVSSRPLYGERSKLVQALLREWLERHDKETT